MSNEIQVSLIKFIVNFQRFVLLLGIGLLVLLGYWFITQQTFAQEPNSVSEQLRLEQYSCKASNPASFKSCLQEARQTGTPFIQITAPIVCTSVTECSFELKNHSKFLEIAPTKAENKFIRQGDFSYVVLTIDNSSNIELNNLSFEDQGASGCLPGTTCPPFLIVNKASDITFNKVAFSKTAGPSLFINDSRAIKILSSNFKNSLKNGLEIKTTTGFTQDIEVKDNIFDGNSGSALTFQAWSLTGASVISNNKFINNHSGGSYSNCAYPCTGAQVKIFGPTANLRFDQNAISGGLNTVFDTLGLYSSGVEIGGQNLTNVTLFCNEISGNRGSGIVQSPPFRNINQVRVSENKIFNNGLNLNVPTVVADENNCYTAECALSCKIVS